MKVAKAKKSTHSKAGKAIKAIRGKVISKSSTNYARQDPNQEHEIAVSFKFKINYSNILTENI